MATIKGLVEQNHWTQLHLDFSRLSRERKDGWLSRIAEFKNELEKINCHIFITGEGRPGVSQPLKFKLPSLENDSESNWLVAERSR